MVFFFKIVQGVELVNYTKPLNENKDFLALYKRGRYVSGREIVVYYKKNGLPLSRLGITTGKKIGNAVIRSRCRRIIRQAYRENEPLLPPGYDIVIMARPPCADAKSTHLSRFIKNQAVPKMLGAGAGSQRPRK